MLVGVMSDSHDNLANVRRAAGVFNELGVDLVIHLGDIVAPFTLIELAGSLKARVEAVYGNNCGEKEGLRRAASKVGAGIREPPYTLTLDGRRILLLHGFGSPENTVEIVDALAESRRWDAVLYGHTHDSDLRYKRGVLVLNPGETGGWLGEPSVAVLDTSTLKARIIWLDKR
ncbi:MAG: metallophosphoesterase [Desulfurococcales archaeon]|nr:metallophosphoesterase [Desulfurococcales archaeon]